MKIIRFTGGLGNQMFQYVFYKYMGKNNIVKADLFDYQIEKMHNGYELENIFNIKLDCIDYETRKKYEYVPSFGHRLSLKVAKFFNDKNSTVRNTNTFYESVNNTIVLNCFDNRDMYYSGFWQDKYYLLQMKNEVKELFEFPEIADEKNKSIVDFIKNNNTCSIHVRRGDYLNESIYCNYDMEYYLKAIEKVKSLNENVVFIVFSNDIQWCKDNFSKVANCVYVDWNVKKNSYVDLQIMTLCKNHIIANSTFSWWGAVLSVDSGVTIAPCKWYTFTDYNPLVLDEWIKI